MSRVCLNRIFFSWQMVGLEVGLEVAHELTTVEVECN